MTISNVKISLPIQIEYSEEEHLTWFQLFSHQSAKLKQRALPIFEELLSASKLPKDHIPQLAEVSRMLEEKCGWRLAMVEGILPARDFFSMLALQVFPSTTFIRHRSMHFSSDPDIFHELFGHIPMLLDQQYASFLKCLTKQACSFSVPQQAALQRLIWFTLETGLVETPKGIRTYGAALLSSPAESELSLRSQELHQKFNIAEIIRSRFSADSLQERYYVINSLDNLYKMQLKSEEIDNYIEIAKALGEHPSRLLTEKDNKYSSMNIL